ncbi:MAG: hypothetical protein WBB52_13545 [Acidimicrobiales bacterium]
MFVTAQSDEYIDLGREVGDALRDLGIDVREIDGILTVDGTRQAFNLVARAHPTPADLTRVVSEAPARLPALVVADRLSQPGRDVLRRAGWGWLDRRGHIRVWAAGLRIEAPFSTGSTTSGPGSSGSGNPWTHVGLEVALAALIQPDRAVQPRATARMIGRSAAATHQQITRFTEVGLIGPTSRLPLLPELFWETAAHWPDDGWTPLPATLVEVAERSGADALTRVDERAATLGGASIPAAGDLPARCYVRSEHALRRLRGLVDRNLPTRTWVRLAPVKWLPENDDHPATTEHPWRVAHPIVCALRLAADPARGREIVETWGVVPGGET